MILTLPLFPTPSKKDGLSRNSRWSSQEALDPDEKPVATLCLSPSPHCLEHDEVWSAAFCPPRGANVNMKDADHKCWGGKIRKA